MEDCMKKVNKIKREKRIYQKPLFYFSILVALLLIVFILQIVKLGMIPVKFLAILIAMLVVLFLISFILMTRRRAGIFQKIFGFLIAMIIGLGSCLGTYYMHTTYNSLSMMTNSDGKINKVTSVYVLKNGTIETADDLSGRTVGIMKNFEESKGATGIGKMLYDKGIEFEYKEYDSAIKMIKDLKGQAIEGIVIDQSYLSTIEDFEEEKDIRQQIKPILDYKYYEKVQRQSEDAVDVTSKPFSVLISGIDTYGQIATTSRSDVNMIVVVNPTTHEILMVSIPRDYYVETRCENDMGCAYGEMDKLTHTGLHGIETTEMTLENLFDMKINYNARVNFSSVVDIVDELGGVDVDNANSFSFGGYHFEPGRIHLDGKQALAFSRERYSFVEGDRERGRNQMRVMDGIIQKMISPQILKNFSGILNAVGNSFQTNMSMKDMSALVNMQLSKGGSWKIYSCSVNGEGGTDFAYELGDNAYVMYPDKKTIVRAKENIDAVKNGDVPPYADK